MATAMEEESNWLELILLCEKIEANIDEKSRVEWDALLTKLKNHPTENILIGEFSKAVRLFGKKEIQFSSNEDTTRRMVPSSVDKAVRRLILLHIPSENEKEFLSIIEKLFSSADVGEQCAIYSSFDFLPFPEKLVWRCMEGIRSNMGEVFESIAHENLYPAEYLSEEAFNQMVLKCLFVGKPLYKILNLHQRLNKNLARMAGDYAHERWAAGREVNPELWQLLYKFLEQDDLEDIQRLFDSENKLENKAANLVCAFSDLDAAKRIYKPDLYRGKIQNFQFAWEELGKEIWSRN